MADEDAISGRYHIFDDPTPNPIRLRTLIGANLGSNIFFMLISAVIFLLRGDSMVMAWGRAFWVGGIIGAIVTVGFWLVPIASCVCESIALGYLTPGIIYKVTPFFMATYGIAFMYAIYDGARTLIPHAQFIHLISLSGWRLHVTLCLVGFALSWVARHVLIWLYGWPLFRAGVSLPAIGAHRVPDVLYAPRFDD